MGKGKGAPESGWLWSSRGASCLKWQAWTSNGAPSIGTRIAQAADSHEISSPAQEDSEYARRIEKFREDGATELQAREKDLAEQIFRLRFQLSTGQARRSSVSRSKERSRAREDASPRTAIDRCSQAGEGR